MALLKDLLQLPVWALAFTGSDVVWRRDQPAGRALDALGRELILDFSGGGLGLLHLLHQFLHVHAGLILEVWKQHERFLLTGPWRVQNGPVFLLAREARLQGRLDYREPEILTRLARRYSCAGRPTPLRRSPEVVSAP